MLNSATGRCYAACYFMERSIEMKYIVPNALIVILFFNITFAGEMPKIEDEKDRVN